MPLVGVKRIRMMNIPVDVLSMEDSLRIIDRAIEQKQHLQHGVINAGKVVAMQRDKELFQSVCESDMINADGFGIVWASKKLGYPLPERVAGIDLMQNLVSLAGIKGYRIFFFGAKEEVVQSVVSKYQASFGEKIIAGYRNGYYQEDEEREIAQAIADSGADMLFVAMSSPKKEYFLHRHKDLLSKVPFIMGVGGSFDVVSGKVKRAPLWLQKLGLEGLARFVQEPKKMWKRFVLDNYRFIKLVYKWKGRPDAILH